MKGFFYSNQSLVIVLGSVLFLVVLYFIIKALPTKVSKKQAKEEKKEEKKQEPEKVEIKEASPYITEDRDDIWNLTRLEDYTPIDEARERGIFLHNVLSNVNRIEDLPISINRWGYKARLDKESIE